MPETLHQNTVPSQKPLNSNYSDLTPLSHKVQKISISLIVTLQISGKALSDGVTHQENQFTIDTREAGYGGLSLSIEGPSKADIQCKVSPRTGSCNL